jgi:hypothetical protein
MEQYFKIDVSGAATDNAPQININFGKRKSQLHAVDRRLTLI